MIVTQPAACYRAAEELAMVRFSYAHIPAYPLDESIRLIKVADELGFYAAYACDETWWKDMWLMFAAAAGVTRQIRLGPNVTHVILRDPAHIVQMLGTLDELSGGRAECVMSSGNQSLLPQHGVDVTGMKPLSRVIEAHEVMRALLDTGTVAHAGEFFTYPGLWTKSRPVQEHLPIKLGAMGGPRSFRVAGEKFDGLHHALGYTRDNFEYVMENLRAGADSAGRDWRELDLAAWVVWACAEDSAAAKEMARMMVAFYLAAMPENQLQRHGITGSDLKPILDAFDAGDTQKALDLTSPELGELLSISGTPEECLAKLQRDILPTGINHIVAGVVDTHLLKVLADRTVPNGVDAATQLQLIHDRVMPQLQAIGAELLPA
jgi:5,10-methylenetetrahydromethanopterin reductase